MPTDRLSRMQDSMITAVDEGFSYDGIVSIPETGLEDVRYDTGPVAWFEDGVEQIRETISKVTDWFQKPPLGGDDSSAVTADSGLGSKSPHSAQKSLASAAHHTGPSGNLPAGGFETTPRSANRSGEITHVERTEEVQVVPRPHTPKEKSPRIIKQVTEEHTEEVQPGPLPHTPKERSPRLPKQVTEEHTLQIIDQSRSAPREASIPGPVRPTGTEQTSESPRSVGQSRPSDPGMSPRKRTPQKQPRKMNENEEGTGGTSGS